MRTQNNFKLFHLFLLCILVAATKCVAVTIHVPSDQPTIQAGIDAAANGDTVLVAAGTYTGDGNRDIDTKGKGIVIRSAVGPQSTVIDCQGTQDSRYRAFWIKSGEDSSCKIEGFTIQGGTSAYSDKGGNAGGAMLITGSHPTVRDCQFRWNWAITGGAVAISTKSASRFVECRFLQNTSEYAAGAIDIADSCLVGLDDCRFDENIGGHGVGGIACGSSKLDLTRCSFWRNASPATGAFLVYQSLVRMTECTITMNYGSGFADAFLVRESDITIDRCLIALNGGSETIRTLPPNTWNISCTDIFGNAGGDWIGEVAAYSSQNRNFSADPLFCDIAAGNLTISSSSPCAAANSPCDSIVGAFGVGCSISDVFANNETVPNGISLHQNYPNPFNPSTTIEFEIDKPARAVVRVYNAIGEIVRTLVDRQLAVGTHRVVWDGRDDRGREVASGVYLYRLTAGGLTQEKKMVLVR